MRRILVTIPLLAVFLLPALTFAQKNVYGGTGAVRFKVNRAGAFALYDTDFYTQLNRASLVVALDSAHVFDYEEDAMYLTTSAILSSVGKADTVATALFDNSWNAPPPAPDVRALMNAYAWKNDSLVVVDYSITNWGSTSYTAYIGLGCVPEPSETYGGETVAYDTTKQMAYFFREGETPYVGIILLGASPSSFHVLDWDTYSPSDANSDAATDSTRWLMTATSGYDAPLVAGVDGSFFNLNFGSQTIASRGSVEYTVAYLYSTSLAGLRVLADSAESRFTQLGAASSIKNAYGGTGAVGFSLNRAGKIALFSADGTEQLARASMVIGQDSADVFDYQQDAMYLMTAPALSVGGVADTVAVALFDNTYNDPPLPPDVRVLEEVHAWKGDPFVLVDYTVTNYGTDTKTLHMGMGAVPYPSETYGGETVAYDSTAQMAYFYREGEDPYIGIKLIDQAPSSFHPLDWDTYSPTDANSDAATDSTRWLMTTASGFDAPLVGGVDGSFFNINFGSESLDFNSSVAYTVAYLYSTSLSGLRTVASAAVARYTASTAVETTSRTVPQAFVLKPNYPNPFNPATTISCTVPLASHLTIVVYDLLGRKVATVADGHYAAGNYSFRFDGTRLASGVYFCRMTAGSFSRTTKMVLQK